MTRILGTFRVASVFYGDYEGPGTPDLPGERTVEPTFGLPALWIEEARREEALARGCTVVDCAGVVATHLTELVREHVAELLSFAETQKLVEDLPRSTLDKVAKQVLRDRLREEAEADG